MRRHLLAVDKAAARAMLNEILRKVEREKAGLVDPTDAQRKRPLAEHIIEFQNSLANKGVTPKQAYTAVSQLRKIATACKWKPIAHIGATGLLDYLGELAEQTAAIEALLAPPGR